MRIGNVPPTSPTYGSQQPSDIPPQAQKAATDMANLSVQLPDLYAQYTAATTPQQKSAIMARISAVEQAIAGDLNTLQKLSSQLPPDAQAQLEQVASLTRSLAEYPEKVTPSQLAIYEFNVGKLCGQLGC
ncbi:MAG: hypothetical protein HYX48_03560 [Chlamydiales bacterium]|nr:hypothetical protein [Chlamydiales bacterium]